MTENILREDFGLTNWKDGTREGETVAMGVPVQTSSARDAAAQIQSEIVQQLAPPMTDEQKAAAQNFWGAGTMQLAHQTIPQATLLAGAAQNTAIATAEGVNPMQLLHRAGKAGKLPLKMSVVARA